jgi:mono/diheme cytochrome c family protein
MHKRFFSLILVNLFATAACSPDPAPTPNVAAQETGADLAMRLCSGCHAIGADDQSQHPDAPPFRTLSEAYPIDYLAEALAEGIIVGHPDMPVFELSPDQIDAFLIYLKQVQVEPSRPD